MKKKLAIFLAALTAFGCMSACGGGSSSGGLSYTTLVAEQESQTLAKDQTLTFNVDKDITGKDYVTMELETNVPLLGKYVYSDADNASKTVEEEFFIEAGMTSFSQFLDSFRLNAIGNFDKKMKSITFTNKGEIDGEVKIKKIDVSNREFPEFERQVYVEKDDIRVGADLATGGTLTHLERLAYDSETVDEVIDENDNVVVGVNAKETAKQHLSSSVNLINIYDAGRQFQQSYYANVGGTMEATNGENGYTRAKCTTADPEGYYWPYNPVQGGDCNSNPSQIIDFQVTENEIYVKVRAMDWAKGTIEGNLVQENTVEGGVTTKSYMENWYTIKDGMVYVTNRFIDWNGFEGMENIPKHTNELPAAYVVHSLHNFVCYTGQYPWTNGDLEWQRELGSWAAKAHATLVHPEDWFAWVNDEGFGVGVYIPNTDRYASGRSNKTTWKEYAGNCNAYKAPLATTYLYNKPAPTSQYTSCYVTNTDYTAPVVSWTMRTYMPMSYQYVISVDYLPIMRQQFKNIYESGEVTNATLDDWIN